MNRRLPGIVLACAVTALPAAAQLNKLPEPLETVGFEQRIGDSLPLDAEFVDANGARVALGDLLGERPAILVPVYYECPMLCGLVLNGLTTTLRVLELDTAEDFELIVFSIDPGETPEIARSRRDTHLARYDRPGAGAGWHFLTGDEASIRRVADAIGFSYTYRPETDEYAHAAGLVVVTPDGRIARYFYGVEYAPRDLRLGLVVAADGQLGGVVDQVLLYCFNYDPSTGKYSAVVMNIVRAGGLATLAVIGLTLLVFWRRERHQLAEQRNG